MNINVDSKKLEQIVFHYGINNQLCVHMEESAELIQAISKIIRCNGDGEAVKACIEHLAEEIADVIVCISQLQGIFGITDDEIQNWVNHKIDRQIGRIEDENK